MRHGKKQATGRENRKRTPRRRRASPPGSPSFSAGSSARRAGGACADCRRGCFCRKSGECPCADSPCGECPCGRARNARSCRPRRGGFRSDRPRLAGESSGAASPDSASSDSAAPPAPYLFREETGSLIPGRALRSRCTAPACPPSASRGTWFLRIRCSPFPRRRAFCPVGASILQNSIFSFAATRWSRPCSRTARYRSAVLSFT